MLNSESPNSISKAGGGVMAFQCWFNAMSASDAPMSENMETRFILK